MDKVHKKHADEKQDKALINKMIDAKSKALKKRCK